MAKKSEKIKEKVYILVFVLPVTALLILWIVLLSEKLAGVGRPFFRMIVALSRISLRFSFWGDLGCELRV